LRLGRWRRSAVGHSRQDLVSEDLRRRGSSAASRSMPPGETRQITVAKSVRVVPSTRGGFRSPTAHHVCWLRAWRRRGGVRGLRNERMASQRRPRDGDTSIRVRSQNLRVQVSCKSTGFGIDAPTARSVCVATAQASPPMR
jgi:hypothetical protein